MKKLIPVLVMVMVALMLWSPILAEAKDDHKGNHKFVWHYDPWKPFVSLKDKIKDIEKDVYDIQTDLASQTKDIDTLKSEVAEIAAEVSEIQDMLASPPPASGIPFYTIVVENNLSAVLPESGFFQFETPCNAGDSVVSGSYKVRSKNPGDEPPLIEVQQAPNWNYNGWTAVAFTEPVNAWLDVTAVCYGQAPAN